MEKQRIQKVLAEAGVASRRAIEEMVLEGRITVNGSLVAKLPCFVDLAEDEVRVDSRRIRPPTGQRVYVLLNKPRGVVCTQSDPQGRPRAVDLIPAMAERVYCVGRLDVESTGLVLLTNDGGLTQRLTHPSHGIVKTYLAEVEGHVGGEHVAKLKAGSELDGKRTRGAQVKVLRRSPDRSLLEIRLAEGPNREVRRVLARMGHNVRKVKRVAIGSVTDRGLKIGHWRMLAPYEVASLEKAAGPSRAAGSGGAGRGKARRRPHGKARGRGR